MVTNCYLCKKETYKSTAHYNRAIKCGAKMFCSWSCFSESRRLYVPKEVKKEIKRIYDKEYRAKNYDKMRPKRAAYFQKVYKENPDKFKAERQRRMKSHVEYCRNPEYKKYKKTYDRKYRCQKIFGPFWEAQSVLIDLENECRDKLSAYESRMIRNVYNKAQRRARNGKIKRGNT